VYTTTFAGMDETANFRVTYIEEGVRIVSLPAEDNVAWPDGLTAGEEIKVGDAALYALYVTPHKAVRIALEVCAGAAEMHVCGESDCMDAMHPSKSGGALAGPVVSRAKAAATDAIYYVSVTGLGDSDAGSSSYDRSSFQLRMASGGMASSAAAIDASLKTAVEVEAGSGVDRVALSWTAPEGGTAAWTYAVYRFVEEEMRPGDVLTTQCGLARFKPSPVQGPFAPEEGATTYAWEDGMFVADHMYHFVVLATPPPGQGAFAQAYPVTSMQIGAGKSEGSSSNAKMIVIVVVAVVVVLLLLALVPVVRLYRKAQVLEERLQYEMQDVRNIAGVNGGDAARGPPSAYGQLQQSESGLMGDFSNAVSLQDAPPSADDFKPL